jgi:hypothetical protein
VPVTASLNTYATWDTAGSTYTSLEAAPTYGVLEGGTLTMTRTLPSSGTLSNRRSRVLSIGGSFVPSGVLPKQATHKLVGTLITAGSLLVLRTLRRAFAGALSSSGLLQRSSPRSFTGTLGSSGLVRRGVSRALSGTLASSGLLQRRIARALSGTLGSSGALLLGKIFTRTLSGTLTSSGALGRVLAVGRLLSGTLSSSGALQTVQTLRRTWVGSLVTSGAVLVGRTFTRALSGVLSSSGSVTFVARLPIALQEFFEGTLRAYGEAHLRTVRGPWPSRSSPSGTPAAPLVVLVASNPPPAALTATKTSAPLGVLAVSSPPPPAAPAVKTTAPYSVPGQKPEMPSLHAEPR